MRSLVTFLLSLSVTLASFATAADEGTTVLKFASVAPDERKDHVGERRQSPGS